MHPDNKLTNHGKQVNSGTQPLIPNVNQQQQGPAGGLGPKSVVAGGHGAKANQISPGNSGLKSTGGGAVAKSKAKRDRSTSMETADQRDPLTPILEADAKEGAMRSKRRCVLVKKQPYSGDEWCSGPDTEDDEDKPPVGTHRELSVAGPTQSLTGPSPMGSIGESGCAALGRGLGTGPAQQVVYVFTTSLANSAAEAVLHGHVESIVTFHQQNVPHAKLDKYHPAMKLPGLPEQLNSGTPPTSTPKSQSGTPRPASVGGGVGGHLQPGGTPTPTGNADDEPPQARPGGATPRPGDAEGPGPLPHSGTGVSPSPSPAAAASLLQREPGQVGAPASGDRLSKEQLEHRERSLQTLRDIERLLLRSGGGAAQGEPAGPDGNGDGVGGPSDGTNHPDNGGLPSLGPLRSIVSQAQGLEPTGPEEPPTGPHPGLLSLHPASPPPLDVGGLLGPEGPTPEQMAWRKLQEEYYQEKRRQHHYRMMPDAAVGGPMMRGPPPPYHSKPGEQQWPPAAMMAGGGRMIDMHQEGPRGQRFLGQMHRAPPAGGGGGMYPGSAGGMLPVEAMGPQRPPRPGMGWPEDMPPNAAGGGPFQGSYPPGGLGGPPPHLQASSDRFLTREEMFRMLEKRQLQGLHRMELDRLGKQQAGLGGPRLIDSMAGGGFPASAMGVGGPALRGDPMDFPSSRAMMGSPLGGAGAGAGPPLRDMVDPQMQQIILAQKLRAGPGGPSSLGEMLTSEEISRIRAAPNGRGPGTSLQTKSMPPGRGGPLQYPNQGPFPGGPGHGGYLHQEAGPDMFGPDHQGAPLMGVASRLSHMPVNSGPRGPELSQRHPSDLSLNANPLGSPATPLPHQLKSPSLSQQASPLMASPSAPSLKSSPPQLPATGPPPLPLPAASGAGTPSSSMKSPQVMGPSLGLRSPAGSPGHLKSPAMPVASPAWATSPKTAMPSPGGPSSGKGIGNGGSSSTETGPSLPPRSTNSTPISQPGSMNPSMPFTSSPDAPPTQNPLSLIMSQMSKYAMPSSTPLYHDAIKSIATSDDEMLPDRPLLPGMNMTGSLGNHQSSQMLLTPQSSMGPSGGAQSPMAMVLQGQPPLSHEPPGPLLHSPGSMSMNAGLMGGPTDGMEPCSVSPMLSQNLMGGFSRMQPPTHGPLHSPGSSMPQQYSQPPEDVLPHHQLHLLGKQRPPHPADAFQPVPAAGDSPDLSDVIRPTPTGIPEFDLSRIIPADKPSSTLQYFPKNEPQSHQGPAPGPQLLKQHPTGGPSSNPHIASLQNMMAEQQLPGPHPSHPGMRVGMGVPPGGPRGLTAGGSMGPACHPGHAMGRTGMMPQPPQHHHQHHHHHQQQQQQQAMMGGSMLHPASHPHPAVMSPQQHQQNIMMMQAKQRALSVPGDPYGPQGLLMSPQGPVMMGPQPLRQRGMSLDSPLGYGHGGMANMPF